MLFWNIRKSLADVPCSARKVRNQATDLPGSAMNVRDRTENVHSLARNIRCWARNVPGLTVNIRGRARNICCLATDITFRLVLLRGKGQQAGGVFLVEVKEDGNARGLGRGSAVGLP